MKFSYHPAGVLRIPLLLALLALATVLPEARAARLALVIGNDNYRYATPLRTARTDAGAMAQSLEKNGFQVTLLRDIDNQNLRAGLTKFQQKVSEGDDVVFFYAGHGVQIGITNYLLPVDVRAESESQMQAGAVPLQRILDDMETKKARFSLVIVDACRDNPFKTTRSILSGRGLAPTMAATGQMIIYSAGSGQQALDSLGSTDRDPNGVFTRVFLKELERSGQSVDRLVRSVRNEVVRIARSVGHEQVPALYDQSLGEFFFRQESPQIVSTGSRNRSTVQSIVFANFEGKSDIAQLFRRVASGDLERSGRFNLVDPAGITNSDSQRPDFRIWREKGADYLVTGSVSEMGDEKAEIRHRLWRIADGAYLGGESYVIDSKDRYNVHLAAHKTADLQQKLTTGIPGTFALRNAKVTTANGRFQLWVSDSDGANTQLALTSAKILGMPTWVAGSRTALGYLSLESGQPAFFIQELTSGARKKSASTERVVTACSNELTVLQSGPEPARDAYIKDDWAVGSGAGCLRAINEALQAG